MQVAPLEEERAKRPDTMQTATNATLVERPTRAEHAQLDLATARCLLGEHGYDLVERCGHVHATRGTREWHVCLLADLASLPPARLLACLEEALTLRVEQSIALSPLTYEESTNVRRDGREPFIKQEAP